MASVATKGLRVTRAEGRFVIFVPQRSAGSLRKYLQLQGITSSHPEYVTDDTSSIEIRAQDDLEKVQEMLDQWGRKSAPDKA